MLLQAAGLAEAAGTRLQLTAAGRKATTRPAHEVIRQVWEKWQKTTLLDEFNRVSAIKGQQAKGRGLTAVAPIRAASWALFPRVGCASSARWYATSDASPRKSASSRPRRRASTTSGSFRQKSPWWTSTRSAPSPTARSKSSREQETPQAIDVTSAEPTTWSPCGANSGKRSISSSSFA